MIYARIILISILLGGLAAITVLGQNRQLTQEAPVEIYSASINSGRLESQGGMRVAGNYRDIFDTRNWGNDNGHIWRIYIASPIQFMWTDRGSRPNRVELIIHEMSLSQGEKLSSLVVKVNDSREIVLERAVPIRRTVLDITSLLRAGNNVVELSSREGTDLLHGVRSVEVIYQRATESLPPPRAKVSALDGARFFALIIGVQNYADPKVNSLDYPLADASRMKEILTNDYMFDQENIIFLRDPNRAAIISKFDQLAQQITQNDNLLIFYAGHGYFDEGLKQGFWLPSNARKDSRAEWLSNSTVRDYLGGMRAKHVLLIADACFSGSIFKTREAFTDEAASIQELYRMPSRKAMTSGAMKAVPDRSVFVDYLIKRLKENQESYLTAEELFSSMRKAVINNSPSRQTPQYGEIREAGDEGGDFVFLRRSTPNRPVSRPTSISTPNQTKVPGRAKTTNDDPVYESSYADERPLIVSKPMPAYTEEARRNQVSGSVTLKIVLASSGQIGQITVVEGLPYGLSERAIDAARQIKFTPAKKNGRPISVYATIGYTFRL
jgi:TonB family protein